MRGTVITIRTRDPPPTRLPRPADMSLAIHMPLYPFSLLKIQTETQATIPRPLLLVFRPNLHHGIITNSLPATSRIHYRQKPRRYPRREAKTKVSKRIQLGHRLEITTTFLWVMSLTLHRLPNPSKYHRRRKTDPSPQARWQQREAPGKISSRLGCLRPAIRRRAILERRFNPQTSSSSLIPKSITISNLVKGTKMLARGEGWPLDQNLSISHNGTLKTS